MNHLRKPHLCALGYGCMVVVEGGALGCGEHEAEMASAEAAEMAAAWGGDGDALGAAARPIIARLLVATKASMERARAVIAMKVLFLDIDGVLNSDATVITAAAARGESPHRYIRRDLTPDVMRDLLDPAMCARVARVLDECAASYVLVSGWCNRYRRPETPCHISDPEGYARAATVARDAHVREIVSALRERGITAPTFGALPEASGYRMSDYRGCTRHRSVHAARWLDEHPDVDRWCVIDDTIECYGDEHGGAVRYHDPRFGGHCVHPRDGIEEQHVAQALAILSADDSDEQVLRRAGVWPPDKSGLVVDPGSGHRVPPWRAAELLRRDEKRERGAP
jgi:hypothetical protein